LGGLLSACASTAPSGRDDERLAEAGLTASNLFAQDVTGVSRQLAEGDAITAFAATWKGCSVEGACKVVVPPREVQQQRAELDSVVALRLQAIAGLKRTYEAFKTDAGRDPGENVEATVRTAIAGTWSYATALAGLRLGSASGVSRPVEKSLGYLASLGASRHGRNELARSSEELAQSIRTLRDTLSLETQLYDALAESLVKEKIEVQKALFQAGLVSGADTLRPLAQGLRLNLVRDADYVLSRSPAARTAVEATIEASERAEVRRTQLRYRALISALGELEILHKHLAKGEPLDLRALDVALSRLQSLTPAPMSAQAGSSSSPLATQSVPSFPGQPGGGQATTLQDILNRPR
jgi:hypothetical protein